MAIWVNLVYIFHLIDSRKTSDGQTVLRKADTNPGALEKPRVRIEVGT